MSTTQIPLVDYLVLGDDPHLGQADPLDVEPRRDLRDILVLRSARQDFVADHRERGRPDACGHANSHSPATAPSQSESDFAISSGMTDYVTVTADAPAGRTQWLTIGAIVCSLLVGTTALMASIAFSFQRYFEYQIEAARQISQ